MSRFFITATLAESSPLDEAIYREKVIPLSAKVMSRR